MKKLIIPILSFLFVTAITSCNKEEDNNNNDDDNVTVTKYNCVSGTCTEDENGQYGSLQDCEENCSIVTGGVYDCVSGNCEESTNGQYTTLAECESNCSVAVTKYDCVSGNCEESANGAFDSLSDCQANCSSTITTYECVSGNCELDANGQYASLSDCQANCSSISVGPCDGGATTLTFGGQTYSIKKIGTQCWMTENVNLTTSGECFDANTNPGCGADFGRLYTFAEAQTVCPNGWRLPTNQDFVTLVNYLGGFNEAGGKMKDVNFGNTPNVGATNESEFSAKGGGFSRVFNGNRIYEELGQSARFWTSTEDSFSPGSAFQYIITASSASVSQQADNVNQELSCRCIKE